MLYSVVHRRVEQFCELILYDSDVCLVFDIFKNYHFKYIQIISHHLEKVIHDFGLAFAVPKCSISVFGDHGIVDQVANLSLISVQTVDYNTSLNYLGILIDKKLTFIPHYNLINDKCDKLFGILARI